jgi:hypothetical protein
MLSPKTITVPDVGEGFEAAALGDAATDRIHRIIRK